MCSYLYLNRFAILDIICATRSCTSNPGESFPCLDSGAGKIVCTCSTEHKLSTHFLYLDQSEKKCYDSDCGVFQHFVLDINEDGDGHCNNVVNKCGSLNVVHK